MGADLSGADFPQHPEPHRHGPGFPQQQRFCPASARREEMPQVAKGAAHARNSPTHSPTTSRQIVIARTGRPEGSTAISSKMSFGICCRKSPLKVYRTAPVDSSRIRVGRMPWPDVSRKSIPQGILAWKTAKTVDFPGVQGYLPLYEEDATVVRPELAEELLQEERPALAGSAPSVHGPALTKSSAKTGKGNSMTPLEISAIILACVFGGALVGMALRAVLPKQHLSSESKDVVKMGICQL
jgi:hypothetical protein